MTKLEEMLLKLGYCKFRSVWYKTIKPGCHILLNIGSLKYLIDLNYLHCSYQDNMNAEEIAQNDIKILRTLCTE